MSGNNINIVHVETIENLTMSIQGHLKEIKAKTPKQEEVLWDAVEFITMYQTNQIKALRDEFE